MWSSRTPTATHAFDVVVLGEQSVGKTCFSDMFTHGQHFAYHSPIFPTWQPHRKMSIADLTCEFDVMDLNSTLLRHPDDNFNDNLFMGKVRRAHGVVLLYNLCDYETFRHVTNHAYLYLWASKTRVEYELIRNEYDTFGCILVGNKKDLVARDSESRQVSKEEADEWAQSQGMRHVEITANSKEEVDAVMHALVEDILAANRRDGIKDRGLRRPYEDTTGNSKLKNLLIKSKYGRMIYSV